MEIGRKLREARTASGLSQEIVAEKNQCFQTDDFKLGNRKNLSRHHQYYSVKRLI